MTDTLWWDIARAGGLVAAGLLGASVIVGLALTTAPRRARPRSSWRLDLHRFLGGLAVIFLVVHVVGILVDRFVAFGVLDAFVPFRSHWRPWAVTMGVVAMYLLVAIELTSLARARLPMRVWRAIHYLSFPLFGLVQIHILLAGTDRNSPLVLVALVACDLAVAALLVRRGLIEQDYARREAERQASAATDQLSA
jgi:methionine sulfoxide reductase heme-binding subunit